MKKLLAMVVMAGVLTASLVGCGDTPANKKVTPAAPAPGDKAPMKDKAPPPPVTPMPPGGATK